MSDIRISLKELEKMIQAHYDEKIINLFKGFNEPNLKKTRKKTKTHTNKLKKQQPKVKTKSNSKSKAKRKQHKKPPKEYVLKYKPPKAKKRNKKLRRNITFIEDPKERIANSFIVSSAPARATASRPRTLKKTKKKDPLSTREAKICTTSPVSTKPEVSSMATAEKRAGNGTTKQH